MQYPGGPPGHHQNSSLKEENSSQKDSLRDYLRTMFYPFQNDQLKELVHQIEIYIQMLYQVLLFSSKPRNETTVAVPPGSSKPSDKQNLAAATMKD